jgi:DNA-binding transcriptional MerR regulator
MNSNNPSEQRAYQRRLKRLRARDRRWSDHGRRLQEINEAYDELRQEHHALDGDLRPARGRRNREIDDGGLD